MSDLPHISPLLVRWFTWYSRRVIQRHFHSLRISTSVPWGDLGGRPVVLYTNHASWWDPLVGLVVINAKFNARQLYAPIDAVMLQRYKMFSKMGFFGVEKDTRKGAADFLRQSTNILTKPDAILAVTAQGRFADVRERPVGIKRGLGHLSLRVPDAVYIPVCIEYVYWEEKLPEILVRFGSPVKLSDEKDLETNLVRLERGLETTQDDLAARSVSRDIAAFSILVSGRAGLGGIYDRWRTLRATLRGEEFKTEIGSV